jgi:hypothetical protein
VAGGFGFIFKMDIFLAVRFRSEKERMGRGKGIAAVRKVVAKSVAKSSGNTIVWPEVFGFIFKMESCLFCAISV